MSSPVIGYPDWQRTAAKSRLFDLPYFGTTINAVTGSNVYATANIDSLVFVLFALNGHGKLEIQWYADAAGTVFLISDTISVRQGARFNQSILVKGATMRHTATPAGAAWTLSMLITETARSTIPQSSSIENLLQTLSAVPVGAGVTVDTEVPRLWCAPAIWTVGSSLATWTARLQAIEETGTFWDIDFVDNTFSKEPRPVYLPACTVRTRLTNTTGAGGQIRSLLIGQPGLSGM